MQLSPRLQNTGKFVVIGGLLAATYLVFAVTAMRVALKVREVQVPDLRNRTVAEATTAVADDGLVLNVDDRARLDPKIPSGRIAVQDPPPGSTTRRQRSIRVWLSQGARVTTIPALTGESERSAQLRLREDGLAIVALSEVRSSDYPSGTVIAQEPPAASHGTEVALLVNRGEQSNG